ncbi:sigma-70 family RNA polymerase sigma factor [Sulfitobacter sp. 1A13679]|uniref:sigma-70 family RNA polymerase sigma factor n=1 Tax=Sulfitobacter sp. 1A13679 TaxID=3368597 RepID=UPI003747B367
MAWLQHKDEHARDLLINSCMGMVRRRASKMLWSGLTFKELEAEGIAALYEAADTYKPGSCLFSTHAYAKIIQPMLKLAQSAGNPYSIPMSRPERKLQYKLKNAIWKYESAGETPGRAFDLACEELGLSHERAADSLATRAAISIQSSYSVDDEHCIQIKSNEDYIENRIDDERVQTVIREVFAGLSEQEKHILLSRMLSENPPSLDDLAAHYAVPRSRIMRIRDEALRHVRFELKRRRLELSDLISMG